MNNAQASINTLDHKPSTEELIQQTATVRWPTPVRPVSQPALQCTTLQPQQPDKQEAMAPQRSHHSSINLHHQMLFKGSRLLWLNQ